MFMNRIESKSDHHKLDKGEQRFAVETSCPAASGLSTKKFDLRKKITFQEQEGDLSSECLNIKEYQS